MTRHSIAVTLRPGYLARYVVPVVAKAPGPVYRKRQWRLYGEDRGGARFPLTARQIEAERQRRQQRQTHAPLPCGGLWDETAQRQQELF